MCVKHPRVGIATQMATSSVHAIAPSTEDKRNETALERCDRNLVELLQEVRVVQTGVQVLFAFLLAAPLTNVFHRLGPRQHAEFYVTFVLTGLAALLLIAPTAYHRALFRQGDKVYLVQIANRLTIAGLGVVGASMVGAVTFVTDVLFGPGAAVAAGILAATGVLTFWALLPLARRRELRHRTQRQSTLR